MGYNIIGDTAGRFDELMLLLDKMPKGEQIISLGDECDRGPKSKEVIEFFMKNGKSVFSNHTHMMLDFCRGTGYYNSGTWLYNGGHATLQSFSGTIPEEVLTWIEFLPKYIEIDDCLLSHSFVYPGLSLKDVCKLGNHYSDQECDQSIIWNRERPIRMPEYKMQIAGHNSRMERYVDKDGHYAICLDDSRNKKLTGIHYPSMQIFQQEYLGL